MSVREVSAREAHELLAQRPGAVYLDVRTEDEFAAGRPAGAVNVPVIVFDPRAGQPRPNPDFVALVAARFAPSTPLLVGCQSGVRSLRACELLLGAGYTELLHVRSGFGGVRGPGGRVIEPGWEDSGLPVESGPGAKP
jgi:rhodanese-related sulfurtransferase